MLQIWRKPDQINFLNLMEDERPKAAQFILALTDNWSLRGNPVDWGIEPVMAKIKASDTWRDDTGYDKFVIARERREESRNRAKRNEIKAWVGDVHKELKDALKHDLRMR